MSDNGWGYIEIMVCTLIISIMSAVAIPMLGSLQKYQVDQEVMFLLGQIRELKTLNRQYDYWTAVPGRQGSTPLKIVIESDCHSYFVIQNGKILMKHRLPDGVHMQYGRQTMYFYNDGSSLTNTYTIKSGQYARSIVIDIVGRIRVE